MIECHLNYEMRVTGWKYGCVAPDHIRTIEEIPGFIECQEQFEEYQNFYRVEIKMRICVFTRINQEKGLIWGML